MCAALRRASGLGGSCQLANGAISDGIVQQAVLHLYTAESLPRNPVKVGFSGLKFH